MRYYAIEASALCGLLLMHAR